MKRRASQFPSLIALAVAVALLATSTLASARPSHVDRVEARIKELHAKLNLTQAQEGLWTNVTQVMRDNAHTMDALIKARADHAKTMTAVDDLQSYSDIAEAHAAGLKKFIPVFAALYASMSDAQKQNADTLFRHRSHMRAKRHGSRGHHTAR
jgi:septal ring factor EnvC (AmiA/AmiB activator)